MGFNKNLVEEALKHIEIRSNLNNEPVTIEGHSDYLDCIGLGTDAAVFQIHDAPSYAVKVYAVDKTEKVTIEKNVYERIGDSKFFPTFYEDGSNFLIISYEAGITLYDCIINGIHIPEQVVQDVEEARVQLREKGLNPRDIHLKNILFHNGRVKIIDVSEYLKPGNDHRWEYLTRGYKEFYHLIDERQIPQWMIETVRKWFNQANALGFNYDEFMKKVMKLFMLGSKK